eukprot:5036548-Amphidinium_carterae.1
MHAGCPSLPPEAPQPSPHPPGQNHLQVALGKGAGGPLQSPHPPGLQVEPRRHASLDQRQQRPRLFSSGQQCSLIKYLRVLSPETVDGLLDHLGRRLPGASGHHLHRHPLGDQLGHRGGNADDDLWVTIHCGTVYEDSRKVILTSRDPRLKWGGGLVESRVGLDSAKLRLRTLPCLAKPRQVPELGSRSAGLPALAGRPLPLLGISRSLRLAVGAAARVLASPGRAAAFPDPALAFPRPVSPKVSCGTSPARSTAPSTEVGRLTLRGSGWGVVRRSAAERPPNRRGAPERPLSEEAGWGRYAAVQWFWPPT